MSVNQTESDFIPLSGFESFIHEHTAQGWSVKLAPGDVYVANQSLNVNAETAACVVVCIREAGHTVGGISQMLLPCTKDLETGEFAVDILKGSIQYVSWTLEKIINEMKKVGADSRGFQVSLYGGVDCEPRLTQVIDKTVEYVRNYFLVEDIKVKADQLGGSKPLSVSFNPYTGDLDAVEVNDNSGREIVSHELEYVDKLSVVDSVAGDIELF